MSFLIRCSSLGKIMPEPKTQKDGILSVGAKTHLKSLAQEAVYDYRERVTAKYMEKGNIVEDESIALYNSVFFENYAKNTERRDNGVITGECDMINPGVKGVDIKSAWSLATFPALSEDCHDTAYEWQARGYMALWDVPQWDVAWCMVDTPEELIRYEQRDLHVVSHIDPQMRVSTISYQRDLELEAKIMAKAKAAQEYIISTIQKIKDEHGA
jgi:hypothetical protein